MTQENAQKKRKRPLLTAITRVFIDNSTALKGFLKRFFSEQQDIEDVAQEAYLRAYIAEQHQDIEQPKAYLFRTAKNLALNKLTKKSRQITDYIEESSPSVFKESAASPELELEAEESLGLYCEAVAALPEKCRQVYLLRKVHGLARKNIAERMSLSLASVDKYLCRGILDCRAFVRKREGYAPDLAGSSPAAITRAKAKNAKGKNAKDKKV